MEILPWQPSHPDLEDFGNQVLMAAIVDTHAHINEPGRTDWEGFQTATQAAAAGGIATVIDMPLNSIPATTSLAAFKTKLEAAQGQCSIDYGFWGGVIPGNSEELEPMVRAGVLGFKTFLTESGVDEFPCSSELDLVKAMPILSKLKVPLLVHAELESELPAGKGASSDYQTYLDSRPKSWENAAIVMMIQLAYKTGCHTHIVHLSSAEALERIAAAKERGIPITVETCPHYLSLCAEEIPEGATQYKCAPPIREKANQDALWGGLTTGIIDFIVSDHSPCTPGLKLLELGSFMKAWGGIASLQFSLPVVWTEMHRRGLPIEMIPKLMCERTANFAGLGASKGKIQVGMDADLTVWDPEATFMLTREMVKHKHPLTPYEGRTLNGKVNTTFLRGQKIYDQGVFKTGHGQVVLRK